MFINDRTIKTFEDLKDGDVFMYNTHYYMKIITVTSVTSGVAYNAVHLQTGVLMEIALDAHITPVKCELVIES